MTGVVGVIPAGGSGERLGAERPQAFVVVGGRRLVDYSLSALDVGFDSVVVAVQDRECVPAGPSRSASVRNAVAAAARADVFVVHDAARPLVTRELAERCVAA